MVVSSLANIGILGSSLSHMACLMDPNSRLFREDDSPTFEYITKFRRLIGLICLIVSVFLAKSQVLEDKVIGKQIFEFLGIWPTHSNMVSL